VERLVILEYRYLSDRDYYTCKFESSTSAGVGNLSLVADQKQNSARSGGPY